MIKRIIKVMGLLFLVLLVVALVYYYEDAERFITNREALIGWLAQHGKYSPLLFILVQILQVIAAPIPGEITGIVGGYLYGVFWGSFYSTIGLTAGSAIAFALAHACGEPLVERIIKKELLTRYDAFLEHKGLALAFVFFIIPGFPKDALCYVLGLSHIRFLPFLGVCTLGRLLGTTGLSIFGALFYDLRSFHLMDFSLRELPWGLLISLVAIVIVIIAIFLGRRRLLEKFHHRDKK